MCLCPASGPRNIRSPDGESPRGPEQLRTHSFVAAGRACDRAEKRTFGRTQGGQRDGFRRHPRGRPTPPSAPPRDSRHPRLHPCRAHQLTAPTERSIGLVDVHDHRRSGSLQLGHLRTLEPLVLWSTPPTRCPSTGIERRRRRIRRRHERISPLARKTNATNDFQHETAISKSL